MTKDDRLLHGFTITHITDCVADSTKNRRPPKSAINLTTAPSKTGAG